MECVYCTLCGQNAVFDSQAGGSCSYCYALKKWSYFQLLGRAHTKEAVKHNTAEISYKHHPFWPGNYLNYKHAHMEETN